MKYVFVRYDTPAECNGDIVQLRAGMALQADDPLVAQRPDLFSDDPVLIIRTVPETERPRNIEQATRAPGERRNVRRD